MCSLSIGDIIEIGIGQCACVHSVDGNLVTVQWLEGRRLKTMAMIMVEGKLVDHALFMRLHQGRLAVIADIRQEIEELLKQEDRGPEFERQLLHLERCLQVFTECHLLSQKLLAPQPEGSDNV